MAAALGGSMASFEIQKKSGCPKRHPLRIETSSFGLFVVFFVAAFAAATATGNFELGNVAQSGACILVTLFS